MIVDRSVSLSDLKPDLERFWNLSAQKIVAIAENYDQAHGSPVCTLAHARRSRPVIG